MKTLLSNESQLLQSLILSSVLVMGCGDAVTSLNQPDDVADADSVRQELDESPGQLIAPASAVDSVTADGSETVEAVSVTDDSTLPDDVDLVTYRLIKAASEAW